LKAGASVNGRYGANPPILQAASRVCNARLIALLIEAGAHANAKDSDGKTLVQALCEGSGMDGTWAEIDQLDPKLIDILRRAGAKELQRDDNTNGFTPGRSDCL